MWMSGFPERIMARWWRLWLCLTLSFRRGEGSVSFGCDDGNRLAERDLIPSTMFGCPGPSWSEPSKKLSSIDTKYLPQPSSLVCVDSPILYNDTIPNSGPHRPVGAEYGEYLYCPPQRWIHNLHYGATVLLYHPCVSVSQLTRLIMLARLCLSRYIISPFPQLSTERPLAIVTWGRTLELSHVISSDFCDWLSLNGMESIGKQDLERRKYRLLLTKVADPSDLRNRGQKDTEQEALRHCCMETFSLPLKDGPGSARKRQRAKRRTRTESITKKAAGHMMEQGGGRGVPGVQQSAYSESYMELSAATSNVTQKPPSNLGPGEEPETGKGDNGKAVGQREVRSESSAEVSPRHPGTGAAEENQNNTGRGQEKQGHLEGTRESHTKGKGLHAEERGKQLASRPECVGVGVVAARAGQGQRAPTPRTNEATWAAAALGFLLVLLTLSVLHTRLYRNWRSPPSLYWQHPEQEYDSVAEVIRRRLKFLGRRKRKGTGSRRQECVLLPSSSSEESD